MGRVNQFGSVTGVIWRARGGRAGKFGTSGEIAK